MNRFLFRPCDVATLGFLRIVWGGLLILESLSRFKQVTGIYSPNYSHFRYLLFEWVPMPPNHWMGYLEISLLLIFAIGVFLGLFFRIATVGFGFVYFHLFLIDEIYYNNHYYLTILLSFLLAFTKADAAFSLHSFQARDAEARTPPVVVPAWQYWLIKGQVIILYFYGAIAKFNVDWFRAEPIRYWFSLSESIRFPMNLVAGKEWFAWFASYSGIVIDLICPFLLLSKRTRWIGAVALLSFHLMNSRIFKIGFFPWIGIALLIPFFEPSIARRLWGKLQKLVAGVERIRLPDPSASFPSKYSPRLVLGLFCLYFAIQIIFPLRHFCWDRNPAWTEVGQKFAWRMMLRNKDSYIKFLFDPPEAETWLNEHPKERPQIANNHVEKMSDHPWMLLQYARMLDQTLAANGFPDTKIRVLSVVSLNDRPYRVMIDPSADLTEAEYPIWGIPDWIVRLDPKASQETRPMTKKDRLVAIQEGLNLYLAEQKERETETPDPR